MTPGPHPVELLGGHALGLLDAAEQRELDRHLVDCASCRAELAELAATTDLLAAVPAELVAQSPAAGDVGADLAGDLVLQRALRTIRAERSPGAAAPVSGIRAARAGRPRWLGVAAGLVLLAGGIGAGVAVGAQLPGGDRQLVAQPPDRVLTGTSTGGVVGRAELVAVGTRWTRLRMSVKGLPAGQECRMVVVDRSGRELDAGSWVIGTAPPPRPVETAVAVPADQVSRVEVRTPQGEVLVAVEV